MPDNAIAAGRSAEFPALLPLIDGISVVADRYDGYIVDLWGVLHDGVKTYPGAVHALRRLKESGKRIAILSNAPRRAEQVAGRTAELGVTPDLYDFLLTSGEDAWQNLHERTDPAYAALGRRVYPMMARRDADMLRGLDLQAVQTPAAADFILATGVEGPGETVEQFEPAMREAVARGLAMVCANPDLEVVRDNIREICAGALALRYEELGGRVLYHGKPHPRLYHSCLARVGLAPSRILGVGDSLRTDIAGAAGVGIDSVLVTGGIHAEELGCAGGLRPEPARIAALAARIGPVPTLAMPAFVW